MNDLPTFRGARVVAHTTANPTRRTFEHDGTGHRPWGDMDSQDPPYPLWRDSSELLGPAPVPYNPRTGEPLHPVPADATIPAGATYYRTAPSGNLYGPFDAGEPYPLARRNARNTYWTVDPLPEPAPEAGPSWWADLTDEQRAQLEELSGDQAKLIASLIQYKPGEHTLVLALDVDLGGEL